MSSENKDSAASIKIKSVKTENILKENSEFEKGIKMGSSLIQIERLDDQNYDTWKIQMKSILINCDLWGYANGTCKKPTEEKEIDAWTNKDQKALATINLYVKPAQLIHIKRCETSSEAWKMLEQIHQPRGPTRKVTLFRQLLQTRMSESQDVSEHLKQFFSITERLNETGISLQEISEELLTIILLSSLPRSYDNFVIAIESRDQLPSINALKSKLLEEGHRRDGIKQSDDPVEQLCFSSSKSKVKARDIVCYFCKKKGHFKVDCRKRKQVAEKGENGNTSNKKNEQKGKKMNTSFAVLNSIVNWCAEKNVWIVDSGSTSHMCTDKSLFTKMVEWKERIELPNEKFLYSSGIGDIVLKVNGITINLKNVLFVPDLNFNFISVSKVVENGYSVTFDINGANIKRGDTLILRTKKVNNLFILRAEESTVCCNVTTNNDEVQKWHNRYGHLNIKSLCMLKDKNMVYGLKLNKTDINKINCDVCAKGKIHSLPFGSSNKVRTSEVLELVHSDICGPMRKYSNGGAKYFALFIDDYSRKIYVYFLKQKSEIFEKFIQFKTEVEKQTNKSIKALRSDNGREYLSAEFSEYLRTNGIRHELTAEYTPQQNGVAERANRTIVEMARCLLIESQLPESYWGEAVNTSVYLKNRSPTKVLGDKTPHEVWFGVKPNVSHIRTFGCNAVLLDKRPGKSKFQPKGIKCILVGYCDYMRTYRLYEPTSRKLYKSRDVIFFEKKGNFVNNDSDDSDYIIVEAKENETEKEINLTENNGEDIKTVAEKPVNEENSDDEDDEVFVDAVADTDIQDADEKVKGIEENVQEKLENRGRRRIIRTGLPGRPRKMHHTSLNMVTTDLEVKNPTTVKEALSREDSKRWLKSMESEYHSLIQNNTWELVDLPKERRAIQCKWVFNIKRDKHGEIERYKSRLVAKGCSQIFGKDYCETFSPVARSSTIRLILALAAEFGLLLHQVDITSAYLNSDLSEEVYMQQPEHFVDKNNPNKVCRLKKAIYGLKQSGREWNTKLDGTLKKFGFKQCSSDNCVYTMNFQNEYNIVVVYVDDILILCSNEESMKSIKHHLECNFDMVDKGPAELFLGMEIERDGERGAIQISQRQLIQELLFKINMKQCRAVSTPLDPGTKLKKCSNSDEKVDPKMYQSLIGSLMYIGISTRLDIAYAVSKLAQFNQEPSKEHLKALKHVVRYLANTINLKLNFSHTGEVLTAHTDADWAGDLDDRKSYSGYVFMLAGGAISWMSSKQTCVALSSTEAEYVAIATASKEAVHLRRLICEMGFRVLVETPTTIYNDNLSAQKLLKNPVFHSRTKHIDIRVHYVRDIYKQKEIETKYMSTDDMVADILTKSLNKTKHSKFTYNLGFK